MDTPWPPPSATSLPAFTVKKVILLCKHFFYYSNLFPLRGVGGPKNIIYISLELTTEFSTIKLLFMFQHWF